MTRHPMRETELNAILVAPNRELADLFLATVPRVRAFKFSAICVPIRPSKLSKSGCGNSSRRWR